MSDKIRILMATYNGEKYIEEQIKSIINQTYCNWELLIRDDNSTDKTVEIIEYFIKSDKRIKLIQGPRLGSAMNFSALLQESLAEKYVMFSDQDDVWDNYKIEKVFNRMKAVEHMYGLNYPVLVYSDKIDVDHNLNELKDRTRKYKDDLISTLAQCHIYGCTMMLNNALVQIVTPIPNYAYTHDYWISLCALVNGKIEKIEDKTLKYRQHEGNVTGGKNNYSIYGKLKTWKKVNIRDKKLIYQNLRFCMDNNLREETKKYLNVFKKKGIVRIILARKYGLKRDRGLATLRYYYNIWSYKDEYKD